MTTRIDTNLLNDIKGYGAVGVEKCINCGNCTAICSMTSEDSRFPRDIIRMAQLGMKDEILGSKELWLCYNCGQCSDTCPQGAEPANLMSAARSYAIANYAPLKIGKLFSRYSLFGWFLTFFLFLFFGLFIYSERLPMPVDSLRLFGFISRDLIHNLGLAVMVVVICVSLFTIYTMLTKIMQVNNLNASDLFKKSNRTWFQAFYEAVVVQSFAQKKYRDDCETTQDSKSWLLSKWFVHAAIMWGFLGLLLATALSFLLDVIGIKPTGTFVPLWYPTRLIGTLSGLLFMYGVTILFYKRIWSVDKAHSYSHPTVWIFLSLLWMSGVTGFIIEIALYLPGAPQWGYWMFIFHVAVSITLLLLLPFTKFAHAIYRIIALYIQSLNPIAGKKTAVENEI